MIYELREYTLMPGKQPAFVKLAGEVGRKVRGDDYGKLEGYWTSEFGTLNTVFSLWSFESIAERERLLAALAANTAWSSEYLPEARRMIVTEETSILSAALSFRPPAETGNLYELRRYRTHPGKVSEWLEHIKAAAPAREKYSHIVGIWHSDIGPLNRVVHMWSYPDLNARAEARTNSMSDPDWSAAMVKVPPLLAHMESTILVPAPFSPVK